MCAHKPNAHCCCDHEDMCPFVVGVRTGRPPGLLQDDDKKLSKWLASRPDGMKNAREAASLAAQKGAT